MRHVSKIFYSKKGKIMKLYCHFFVSAMFLSAALVQAANVTVNVSGIKGQSGMLRVALCSKQEFLKSCEKVQPIDIKGVNAIAVFKDIKPGVWAVIVLHDENNNGKLDRDSKSGMPTEGYGFSMNPVLFGPPRFEDAAISVQSADISIPLTLQY